MTLKTTMRYRCATCEGAPFIDPNPQDETPAGYEAVALQHLLDNPTHELTSRVILVDVQED